MLVSAVQLKMVDVHVSDFQSKWAKLTKLVPMQKKV